MPSWRIVIQRTRYCTEDGLKGPAHHRTIEGRLKDEFSSLRPKRPIISLHSLISKPCAHLLFIWDPFIWTAAGNGISHPVLDWLCVVICRLGNDTQFNNRPLTPEVLRLGFLRLRQLFREVGVSRTDDLGPWSVREGVTSTTVQTGHYLGPSAHNYIFDRACRLCAECGALESACEAAARCLHANPIVWRYLSGTNHGGIPIPRPGGLPDGVPRPHSGPNMLSQDWYQQSMPHNVDLRRLSPGPAAKLPASTISSFVASVPARSSRRNMDCTLALADGSG